ncbi:MAG: sigma-70 family RNA polymerase sigma factor [Caldilineaceae bacterium]
MRVKSFDTATIWPPPALLPGTHWVTTDVQRLLQIFQSSTAPEKAATRAHAFSAIYNRYCQPIWEYIFYQLDGAEAEAKDIFGQVWLVALEELDRFEYRTDSVAEDPLRSWLFRCAANRVKQFHREKQLKAPLELVESFLWARLSGEDTSLLELFAPTVKSKAAELLFAVTERLNQEQKVILRLRYHGNMSFMEIGDYLGKSEGAVKVQHHRLLKKLRTLLEESMVWDTLSDTPDDLL